MKTRLPEFMRESGRNEDDDYDDDGTRRERSNAKLPLSWVGRGERKREGRRRRFGSGLLTCRVGLVGNPLVVTDTR